MEIKYENKYIAFIDVLGFSSLVHGGKKEKLEQYFIAVEAAFQDFDVKKAGLQKLLISDSIIFIVDDDEAAFKMLLEAIRTLQAFLSTFDIWIRGGVTFGEVCFMKDKNIIVGEGFIKAYLLEKQAKFPRVIIDPSILAKLNLNLSQFYQVYNNVNLRNPNNGKLIHDYGTAPFSRKTEDDAIFVCYANRIITSSLKKLDKREEGETLMLEGVYENIKKNLYGAQQHYSKYLWLKKYFLEVLEEYSLRMSPAPASEAFIDKLIQDFKSL